MQTPALNQPNIVIYHFNDHTNQYRVIVDSEGSYQVCFSYLFNSSTVTYFSMG